MVPEHTLNGDGTIKSLLPSSTHFIHLNLGQLAPEPVREGVYRHSRDVDGHSNRGAIDVGDVEGGRVCCESAVRESRGGPVVGVSRGWGVDKADGCLWGSCRRGAAWVSWFCA